MFQSIDLNKSGSVDLNEIVKKMGKERAIMIYREINNIIDWYFVFFLIFIFNYFNRNSSCSSSYIYIHLSK